MKEKSIEAYLVMRVKQIGGIAPKFVSPGNDGVPDRIVIVKSGVYFVETKAPRGRLRKLQIYQQTKMMELGADVRVLKSKAAVDAFIEEVRK